MCKYGRMEKEMVRRGREEGKGRGRVSREMKEWVEDVRERKRE